MRGGVGGGLWTMSTSTWHLAHNIRGARLAPAPRLLELQLQAGTGPSGPTQLRIGYVTLAIWYDVIPHGVRLHDYALGSYVTI